MGFNGEADFADSDQKPLPDVPVLKSLYVGGVGGLHLGDVGGVGGLHLLEKFLTSGLGVHGLPSIDKQKKEKGNGSVGHTKKRTKEKNVGTLRSGEME